MSQSEFDLNVCSFFNICIVIDSAGRAIKYFRIPYYIYCNYRIGKELNTENYLYYINKIYHANEILYIH